jgi:hypothetical protein
MVRGFLAARSLAAAIDAGARTRGELAEGLRNPDRERRAGGWLDVSAAGGVLPVFTLVRSRAVELPQ